MERLCLLPAMLTLMAGGCAMPSDNHQIAEAAGSAAGASCLDTTEIADTIVRDDRTIDFVLSRRSGRVQRNVLPQDCPLLGIEKTFAWESSGNRLCKGDPITVLQNGRPIPGPICSLGRFLAAPDLSR